jgi:hypothetical protein
LAPFDGIAIGKSNHPIGQTGSRLIQLEKQNKMSKKQKAMGRYVGHSSKGYQFVNEERRIICFDKCDRAVVEQFGLMNSSSNNTFFEIGYWELANKFLTDPASTRIIFELKIVAN